MINPLKRGKAQEVSIEKDDIVFACEGLEDCALVEFLTREWDPQPKIGTKADVKDLGWADEFRRLADKVRMQRPAAVLFVFDAEGSRADAVKDLRKDCADAGIPLPCASNRIELKKVRSIAVRVGFHINPHGRRQGAIESLFLPQIRESPDWECLDALIKCYQKAELSVKNDEKTIVRSYIARRKPHNTGLRVALQDGILHCDSKDFDPLKRFLQQIQPGVK